VVSLNRNPFFCRDVPLQAFIPVAYCERHTAAEWRAECLSQIQSLPVEDDPEKRRAEYIAFLKSRTVLYGSTWYFAEVRKGCSSAGFDLL
jgi:hypothetical protein